MKGLKKLRVTIYDVALPVPEAALLKPLMDVKAEEFILQLPFLLEEAKDVVDDTPFEVRRPSNRNELEEVRLNYYVYEEPERRSRLSISWRRLLDNFFSTRYEDNRPVVCHTIYV